MKPNCLVATEIENIEGLVDKLSTHFNLIHDPFMKGKFREYSEANAIFTNPNNLSLFWSESVLAELPHLKVFATASTGTVHIDKQCLSSRGIKLVSITTEFETLNKISSTSELAFLLLLSTYRHYPQAIDSVVEGTWDYSLFTGRQINSLTLGVLGYGRLGKMYANFCRAFGARVVVCDKSPEKLLQAKEQGYEVFDSAEKLFSECDSVALHIHASDDNIKYIDKRLLNLVKNDFTLINTSRGEIVSESDILSILSENPGFRYATDVLDHESDWKNNPILLESKINPRITITPHMGGMTHDARRLAYHRAADLLIDTLNMDVW